MTFLILALIATSAAAWSFFTLRRDVRAMLRFLDEREEGDRERRLHLMSPTPDGARLRDALNRHLEEAEDLRGRTIYLTEDRKRFIADVSHDLRTPLTSLLGYAEMLKDEKVEGKERDHYLERLTTRGNELARLMENFFTLARLDVSEYPLKVEVIDLAEHLRRHLGSFYDDFVRAGFIISVEIPEGPMEVRADADALNRILDNLRINVLRHAPSGDTVHYRLFVSPEGTVLSTTNRAELTEEQVGRLFERMYSPDSSRSLRSGLGLAIVKALMVAIGGNAQAALTKDGMLEIRLVFDR